MSLKTWKKISEKIVYRNPWWTYKKDTAELPNGKEAEYHYVHTNGASMIVPVLDDGKIVFVKQYRYLNKKESIELPCGGVKEGHTYEETAKHELEEEAGFAAKELLHVGEFNPYNGITDELCRVFMARMLTVVPQKPDETEEFEILRLSSAEIDSQIAGGIIWDGMTIAAWNIAKPRILA